ncbi:MAG: TetR/AcrR family transcriptional regulator [Campylobacterales bacterium]|nr:TetR/AcrR family transcriptional regulator [Campylobacterales bacterium]
MPKIVDKVQKRKNIAKSACGLFIEKGFVNLSISQIAQNAGIGKGTIYEYFKSKEDIVFELMGCLQDDYDPILEKNLQLAQTTNEKIKYLFTLFLSNEEKVKTQRAIFREFLGILLNHPTQEIKEFHSQMLCKYGMVLRGIFQEQIEAKRFQQNALEMIPSVFATVEGFFLVNESQEIISNYIDMLCEILEVK